MKKISEQLLETLLDLERSRQRERKLRIESEALLDGLRSITDSQDTQALFQALVRVLHSVFDFEDAFILQAQTGAEMVPIASTSKSIQGSTWPTLAVFTRVLAGRPAATFDVTQLSEWAEQPASVLKNVKSALHIGLHIGQHVAILVVTHSSPRHFGATQLKQAKRFAPLASQALLTLDLQRAATQRDRFFQLSMILMGIVGFDGHFKQFNTAWGVILGYSEDEIKNSSVFDFVHSDGCEQFIATLAQLKGTREQRVIEQQFRCRDGSYRWLSCSLADYPDEQLCYIAARDVTDRIMIEQRLAHDACHDFLTGLFNRASFMERLNDAINYTVRQPNYRFSVLYMDLDQFKMVNDTLGHHVGDELLKQVSQCLLNAVREVDVVARIGGDEFVILLTGVEESTGADYVAQRVHKLLSPLLMLHGHEVRASMSIGISMSTTGYTDALSMLRDADRAMYAAKAKGKSQSVVFHPRLNTDK
jgi:diguanylate cyclase (GGDEF)-like protein/PAS domain S-box-containing protein